VRPLGIIMILLMAVMIDVCTRVYREQRGGVGNGGRGGGGLDAKAREQNKKEA